LRNCETTALSVLGINSEMRLAAGTKRLKGFGPSLVYTSKAVRKMSKIIEHNSQDQVANGQSSRNWRVGSDALEAQAMEAIDTIGDFLRFVDGSIRSEILPRGFRMLRYQTSTGRTDS
jgi:hypothetical protein